MKKQILFVLVLVACKADAMVPYHWSELPLLTASTGLLLAGMATTYNYLGAMITVRADKPSSVGVSIKEIREMMDEDAPSSPKSPRKNTVSRGFQLLESINEHSTERQETPLGIILELKKRNQSHENVAQEQLTLPSIGMKDDVFVGQQDDGSAEGSLSAGIHGHYLSEVSLDSVSGGVQDSEEENISVKEKSPIQ